MVAPASIDLAAAAQLLRESGRYRVLDLLEPPSRYREEEWNLGDPTPLRLALYLDLETTGLDRERDEIIEFSVVPFTYHHETGEIYEVLPPYSAFEQPTVMEISPRIQEITGITPAMVAGQHIDDAVVADYASRAAIVIAHNAEYDRPIAERRFPIFKHKYWACSQRDVQWERFGVLGMKLQHILADACGMFAAQKHRAADDCLVGIHCLAAARLEGRPAMAHLLASARQPTVRVYAMNSPIAEKERLKIRDPRHYRWSDGREQVRGWYVDVKPDAVDAELAWLREQIYRADVPLIAAKDERQARKQPAILTREFTARDRYSLRVG